MPSIAAPPIFDFRKKDFSTFETFYIALRLVFSLVLVSGLASSSAAAQSPPKKNLLRNADIIKLVRAGFEEKVVLNAIETNGTEFDLSIDGLLVLKGSGVSQKIIEAMQSISRNGASENNRKPGSAEGARSPATLRDSDGIILNEQGPPVYGTIQDIKGYNRVYVSVENADSRERIIKALNKAAQFQIVNDPDDAQIVIEYKVLSRDKTADGGDTDLRVRAQMNVVYVKGKKRTIAWSDTSEFKQVTSGYFLGLGMRSTHSETKLTEKFLKALKG